MTPHNWQWWLVGSLVFVGACIGSSAAETGELDYDYGGVPPDSDGAASDLGNSLSEEKASRLKMRSSMKTLPGDQMRSRPVRRHLRLRKENLDPLQKKLLDYNSKLEKERALLQQHEKLLAAERAKFRQHQEQREKLIVAAMRNKHTGAVVPKSYGVNDILEKFKPLGGHKGHLLPQDLGDANAEDENGNNANDQRAQGEDEANDREPGDGEDAGATDQNDQGDEADGNGDNTTLEPPINPKAASGRRRGKLRYKNIRTYDEEEDYSEREPMRSPKPQARRRKKKSQKRQKRRMRYLPTSNKHVVHLASMESEQVGPRRNQYAGRESKVHEKRIQHKRQIDSDESNDDDTQMDSQYRDKILRNNVLRSIF